MKKVPREAFVPEELRAYSYENHALAIGHNQTISQPYIVGYMIDQLDVRPTSKVLEIGTGSGYNLAVLSHLAKRIISIERIKSLANRALGVLSCWKSSLKIKIIVADGSKGYAKEAPYDRIIVTAGAFGSVPQALIDQLKTGGVLIIPVKESKGESLYRITKTKSGIEKTRLTSVRFVPLISGPTE